MSARRVPRGIGAGWSLSIARLSVLLASGTTRVLVLGAPLALATLKDDAPDTPPGSSDFWMKLAISGLLVLIGGAMAGLTLGLMGLDLVNLQVLSSSGSEQEKKDATKVAQLLEKGRHWVLVVLLLTNVVVNESLPIFLDSILGGGVGAVVLSTTLIVIFGEIIPQAVCARYGLRIGAMSVWFVKTLMYLEFPIAYPIAKLLDYLLGESHGTVYKKAELKTFVGIHGHIGDQSLNEDEVTIISAVLELSDKTVDTIMTPLEDLFVLSSDTLLDQKAVDEILALGHSRVPIYEPHNPKNFTGMLIVKKLISYDPALAKPVSSFPLSVLPETSPDSTCLDALNYFQQGRSHILLVSKTPGKDGGAIGLVSLEDVIEEMIGEEIIDETDLFVDVHRKVRVVRGPAKRVAAGKALAPLIQGVIERRKFTRQNTAEAAAAKEQLTKAKAFSKVKIKGGGQPERRSGFVNRLENGGDDNASSSRASSIRVGSPTPQDDAGSHSGFNERTPLMKKENK